ncbi:HAD family hydrolase [Micromonospora sp. LOL_023]|uniref:HAD family hydrolase n=1 Tax=Micromonospora sp. LOL_023 TaxID=3345418 RepID=UPI003A89B401
MDDLSAVVFDFDGLLMDTESTLVEGWRAAWEFYGLELELDQGFWPGDGGDCTEHRLDRLASMVGPSFDRLACRNRYDAYRRQMHASMDFCPGIWQWLADARILGLRCAVASSSPLSWVGEHLNRVGAFDWFDVVATGDEVPAPKPDPGVYLLALARLGVPGRRAVAVEDTPHGIGAAATAGMATVAIPNVFVDPARVAAADLVLRSAAESSLTDVLNRLAGPTTPRPRTGPSVPTVA